MQAVILVDGEGTRLRPLTSTVPKPVVPLVDRPFIVYMLEWLKHHGVDDVILSCGFLATSVRNVLGDGSQLGIRLRFVEEPEPRGTAGALRPTTGSYAPTANSTDGASIPCPASGRPGTGKRSRRSTRIAGPISSPKPSSVTSPRAARRWGTIASSGSSPTACSWGSSSWQANSSRKW